MKLSVFYNISILLFLAYVFSSNSGGRNGNWAAAPGDSGQCSTCHTTSGAGSISLTGVPSSYVHGQSYTMTLTVSDGTASIGGFQIVATNGSTNSLVGSFATQAGQKLNSSSRLVQSTPKSLSSGSVSWPVVWNAPNSGNTPVQFFFAGIGANGNGGNGSGDMGYSGSSPAVTFLPVELTYFKGIIMDDKVQLSWETAAEINSDYFEVERSYSTIDKFESIGKIAAAGNTTNRLNYEFLDENPVANQTIYYRLKQVDFDGTIAYSDIQTVKMKSSNISIFPNFVRNGDEISLILEEQEEELLKVQLVNLMGQVVYTNSDRYQVGVNTIDLPSLSKGTFILSISTKNKLLLTEKIVVD